MDQTQLINLLIQGDRHAFVAFYDMHKLKLAYKIFKLVQSQVDTEDILQEVFIRVWNNKANLDPSQSIEAYLYKIAENLVYDHFRKLSRQSRTTGREELDPNQHVYSHVEEGVDFQETESRLQKALLYLPKQCRQVFIMFKLEGKSYKEIMKEMSISKSTVNNHLLRAKSLLTKIIK